MEKSKAEFENGGLSKEHYERFIRQMFLPQIGVEGQVKLTNAKVLVVGAGGIGCPAATALTGVGIGTIGLVDGDKIEVSNLHRQFLHNPERVGMNKAVSAKKSLSLINNLINFVTHEVWATPETILDIIKKYDLVIDATDNPKSRYLINDACVLAKVPLVAGSALRWEGQCTVYNYKGGPCYRCLCPACPTNSASCSEAGVVAMAPAVVGQLAAFEATKIILGCGNVLSRKMALVDGLFGSFKTVNLRDRNKNCDVCGDNPKITKLTDFDYDAFTCGAANPPPTIEEKLNIAWQDLVKLMREPDFQKDNIIIDVRPETQYNCGAVHPSINVPYDDLKYETKEEVEKKLGLSKKKTVYVMCRAGNNSKRSLKKLNELGYTNVINVVGGIRSYMKDIDNFKTVPNVL